MCELTIADGSISCVSITGNPIYDFLQISSTNYYIYGSLAGTGGEIMSYSFSLAPAWQKKLTSFMNTPTATSESTSTLNSAGTILYALIGADCPCLSHYELSGNNILT